MFRSTFIKTALMIGAVFCCASTSFALTVKDDAGNDVVLLQPAKRIVALTPDLVENLFAIGAQNQLVGVIAASDYPKAAKEIASVGGYSGIDLERIMMLKPDLIVTWKYAFPRQVAALKRMGVPVFISNPKTLHDVPGLFMRLGELTGKKQQAKKLADVYSAKLYQLKMTYHDKKTVSVLYLVDNLALITVTKASWINDILQLCGGENIFADLHAVSPQVSREAIMYKNPQAIIHGARNNDWQQSWQNWPSLVAVKKNKLFTVEPDLVSRAGPRLPQGAEEICQYLDRVREG